MNIHHAFFFCFLSALCDGNTGLVNATVLVHTEGGSITAACPFTFSGRRKFLCKGECRDEDVLVQTDGDRAQRGRYSIIYKEGTFPVSSSVLFVGITQLTKSDSGRYWCVLERPFFPDSYREFEIRVTDAPATFPENLKLPEQQQNEEITAAAAAHRIKVSHPGYILPLVVSVTMGVLFAFVVFLFLNKWKKRKDGLTTVSQQKHEGDLLHLT
ncbi:CMRF35-like molecule 5 [Thunnus maccoyii]|uniref:CMRF35-like molecule 5 n=1 Tax=Thunnus maccoyii TaxID=8240 RepID=UPI001C4A8F8E|nr:CMRF35-like molecule 5 [Thunnus maccoyii]